MASSAADAPQPHEATSSADADVERVQALMTAAGIRVVVCDIDSTLWDGNAHLMQGTITRQSDLMIKDSRGRELVMFAETVRVLRVCQSVGFRLGVSSHCTKRNVGQRVMDTFGLTPFFEAKLVNIDYREPKTTHISRIMKEAKVKSHEVLFFDDIQQNVNGAVKKLGIHGCHVPEGISMDKLLEALRNAGKRRQQSDSFKSFFTKAPDPNAGEEAQQLKRRKVGGDKAAGASESPVVVDGEGDESDKGKGG
ncbi:unnamed protein product [Vitrella brassicaformis CCMP3155]|uniref:Magnesium-dependent phosphatase-1 n=1 Tax=Vitrella brassicaformis (strain CCMP3155) TaxID=1169540 RepID=A0A0G4FFD4_VITBC|nr:unnamed protein product [Vitrella brassicaformis CCMP3155]|mmetsp:Transcript_28662/g.71499  ORF Transcript_28662/g.71499 Transcript_28662/m.71499 type:complete len:252 (-) Transcript_28662:1272-2027(-)|eukprot:CEM11570.1 unnamed protein product [Vitrella brassicaformis CCMP3155]